MPSCGVLEQINNIPHVLFMFLRGHFEAIMNCVALFTHFTIHFRGEFQGVFNDFYVLATQNKMIDLRSQSLCVDPNALLIRQN